MIRFTLPALALLALFHRSAAGQDATGLPARIKPFVEAYCIDCHGPGVQKAGLRLDTLGTDLADEANLAKWVAVHDKIAAGQMPPRKSEQPPRQEAKDFTKGLHDQLHTA